MIHRYILWLLCSQLFAWAFLVVVFWRRRSPSGRLEASLRQLVQYQLGRQRTGVFCDDHTGDMLQLTRQRRTFDTITIDRVREGDLLEAERVMVDLGQPTATMIVETFVYPAVALRTRHFQQVVTVQLDPQTRIIVKASLSAVPRPRLTTKERRLALAAMSIDADTNRQLMGQLLRLRPYKENN